VVNLQKELNQQTQPHSNNKIRGLSHS